jgi:hypothetical protein
MAEPGYTLLEWRNGSLQEMDGGVAPLLSWALATIMEGPNELSASSKRR